jgi:predicted metal-dependent phosphoesterase TrpH
MFKYEMHVHTSGTSKCSYTSFADMITKYKEKGFDGIVMTNHFYGGYSAVDKNLPWEDFVDAYEKEWLEAKAFGETLDFEVIFAVEDGYKKRGKEVLIYGITPEEFKAEKGYRNFEIEQISEFVRKNGGFIAVAHPFREESYIPDPDITPDPCLLDGVEVNNGSRQNQLRDNRNYLALKFAKDNGLKMTCGSDTHESYSGAIGEFGIATDVKIKDTKHLANILHSKQYKLIINGKIIAPKDVKEDDLT